jgi:surface protein
MTDILTNSASIPYGTWGVPQSRAGQASRSLTINSGEVPYNYTPLTSNLYISSDLILDNRTVVTNMIYYARNNIPSYQGMRNIPEEYSPNSINTNLAQNWFGTFYNCTYLTNLPNPFYDTSNATNMAWIFDYCYNLTTVPNFDTSNVTDMSSMFVSCESLTTVPNFDTSNVTNMANMFQMSIYDTTRPSDSSKLKIVPNFNTSKVTNMNGMFENCENLTTIPNFDTSNVTDMGSMFSNCNSPIILPNFNTSNVTSMRYMFFNCYNLTTIPNFDTSKVTNMFNMFSNCYNVQGNFYISSNNMQNARSLFYNTPNYTKNIYCHANTTTYNSIYSAMGGNTYNSNWNAYLKTMENDYAHIWISFGGGYDEPVYETFRFPTNKIAVIRRNTSDPTESSIINIIEVTPYTDYNIAITQDDLDGWISHNGVLWGSSAFITSTVLEGFRFFKDITNMTPDIVDTI